MERGNVFRKGGEVDLFIRRLELRAVEVTGPSGAPQAALHQVAGGPHQGGLELGFQMPQTLPARGKLHQRPGSGNSNFPYAGLGPPAVLVGNPRGRFHAHGHPRAQCGEVEYHMVRGERDFRRVHRGSVHRNGESRGALGGIQGVGVRETNREGRLAVILGEAAGIGLEAFGLEGRDGFQLKALGRSGSGTALEGGGPLIEKDGENGIFRRLLVQADKGGSSGAAFQFLGVFRAGYAEGKIRLARGSLGSVYPDGRSDAGDIHRLVELQGNLPGQDRGNPFQAHAVLGVGFRAAGVQIHDFHPLPENIEGKILGQHSSRKCSSHSGTVRETACPGGDGNPVPGLIQKRLGGPEPQSPGSKPPEAALHRRLYDKVGNIGNRTPQPGQGNHGPVEHHVDIRPPILDGHLAPGPPVHDPKNVPRAAAVAAPARAFTAVPAVTVPAGALRRRFHHFHSIRREIPYRSVGEINGSPDDALGFDTRPAGLFEAPQGILFSPGIQQTRLNIPEHLFPSRRITRIQSVPKARSVQFASRIAGDHHK